MKPWIDRNILIKQATDFVRRNGSFLRTNAKRIASLVEVAAYNSVVTYYQQIGYTLTIKNLGPKKSFKYKIIATGLSENFSYFEAVDPTSTLTICIFHNTKIQSAHHEHLYYTPDVSVCTKEHAITEALKNKRKHSYIANKGILTFIEVKHLVPFPEALFGFVGLVNEFQPAFMTGVTVPDLDGTHFTPTIAFTGVPSEHAEEIKRELSKRYGINIVYGTEKTHGSIADFSKLHKYKLSQQKKAHKHRVILRRFK